MMERLTEKQSSGFDLKAMNGEWCNKYCEQQRVQTCNECGIYQSIQKLAEYEDLEELIGIPLKDLAEIFCKNIPEDCKHPHKAVVLTDDDVDRWNDYKNAEEKGLLLRLPVPIGTTVYKFEPLAKGTERYIKTTVTRYEIFGDSIWFTFANGLGRNVEDFGEYVFLTKEEAEQKLKEMNTNNGITE